MSAGACWGCAQWLGPYEGMELERVGAPDRERYPFGRYCHHGCLAGSQEVWAHEADHD